MSVDIQRVIFGDVILTCCQINPVSFRKNLSSVYIIQWLTNNSFLDLMREFSVDNRHTDPVPKGYIVEYWSILASGLNPAHPRD